MFAERMMENGGLRHRTLLGSGFKINVASLSHLNIHFEYNDYVSLKYILHMSQKIKPGMILIEISEIFQISYILVDKNDFIYLVLRKYNNTNFNTHNLSYTLSCTDIYKMSPLKDIIRMTVMHTLPNGLNVIKL